MTFLSDLKAHSPIFPPFPKVWPHHTSLSNLLQRLCKLKIEQHEAPLNTGRDCMWYLHHATCGLVKTSTKPYLFSNIANTCIFMFQLLIIPRQYHWVNDTTLIYSLCTWPEHWAVVSQCSNNPHYTSHHNTLRFIFGMPSSFSQLCLFLERKQSL
jgi:hypothetical protein